MLGWGKNTLILSILYPAQSLYVPYFECSVSLVDATSFPNTAEWLLCSDDHDNSASKRSGEYQVRQLWKSYLKCSVALVLSAGFAITADRLLRFVSHESVISKRIEEYKFCYFECQVKNVHGISFSVLCRCFALKSFLTLPSGFHMLSLLLRGLESSKLCHEEYQAKAIHDRCYSNASMSGSCRSLSLYSRMIATLWSIHFGACFYGDVRVLGSNKDKGLKFLPIWRVLFGSLWRLS